MLTVNVNGSYGFIPREAQYDCFYFRVKYTAFMGDDAAEAARFAALQTIADDVKQIVRTTVRQRRTPTLG